MTTDLDDIDFEQLIGDRDIDIYKLIEDIKEIGLHLAIYLYACRNGRWLEAEPYLMDDLQVALSYASHVIKGRWPEAEPYIMKDPHWAHYYARDVIKGRWAEAEPYIMKDPEWAYHYACDVIKGRWPEAGPYISEDPTWFACYLRFLITSKVAKNPRS